MHNKVGWTKRAGEEHSYQLKTQVLSSIDSQEGLGPDAENNPKLLNEKELR